MTIKEVTPDQYAALPLKHPHVFNTAAFSRLNAAKAERLHFLVFEEEGKPRYGITLGEREGWLLSPFSAPSAASPIARHRILRALTLPHRCLPTMPTTSGSVCV